jgi:hypothetical protein
VRFTHGVINVKMKIFGLFLFLFSLVAHNCGMFLPRTPFSKILIGVHFFCCMPLLLYRVVHVFQSRKVNLTLSFLISLNKGNRPSAIENFVKLVRVFLSAEHIQYRYNPKSKKLLSLRLRAY